MLIVREVFVARPGMASRLARLLREALREVPAGCRVLTDLVGPFNTVVMETEIESLAAFEKRMAEYRSDERLRGKMAGYAELYTEGRREIFQVVE